MAPRLGSAALRQLAVRASVCPRTIQKVFAGLPVRGLARERALLALEEAGLTPAIRPLRAVGPDRTQPEGTPVSGRRNTRVHVRGTRSPVRTACGLELDDFWVQTSEQPDLVTCRRCQRFAKGSEGSHGK